MGKTIYTGEPTGPTPKRYLLKYDYSEVYEGYGAREIQFRRRKPALREAAYRQSTGAKVEVIDTWA